MSNPKAEIREFPEDGGVDVAKWFRERPPLMPPDQVRTIEFERNGCIVRLVAGPVEMAGSAGQPITRAHVQAIRRMTLPSDVMLTWLARRPWPIRAWRHLRRFVILCWRGKWGAK